MEIRRMPWNILEMTVANNKYIPIMPHQKQMDFLSVENEEALYGGAAGGGKLLALDTLVPTSNGTVTLENVHPGDIVFGIDGQMVTVLAESEVVYDKAWELTFDDGSKIIAHDDHLWLTYNASELSAMTKRDDSFREKRRLKRLSRSVLVEKVNKIHSFEHRKFLSESISKMNSETGHKRRIGKPSGSVRKTSEIVETIRLKSGRANHAIPVCKPLEYTEKKFKVDPYILGVWLGDGTTANGNITTSDIEIIESFKNSGYEFRTVSAKKDTSCRTYSFPILRKQLKELGLIGRKHIPEEYFLGSVKQRLELLRGLIDTDGCVNKNGSVEFCNTNKNLADGVMRLACSLGHKAYVRKGLAKLNGRVISEKYSVKFMAKMEVVKLTRKRERLKIASRRTTNFRYIIDAKRTDKIRMKCLRVSSADSLFLVGDSCIPTHNSIALLMAALQFVMIPGYSALLLRKTYSDLKLPGALIDVSNNWMSNTDAKYNVQEHSWKFPSGATIQFGHAESNNDIYRYRGAEFQFVGIDEASQMTPFQLEYIQSRIRKRKDIPVPLRIRYATNPGGPSHEYIKERYITKPEDRVFISAKLDDNDYIDKVSYKRFLERLDPVSRAQLLLGDWDAVEAGRFKAEVLNKYRYKIVDRGFDQGGSYALLDGVRIPCDSCWKMITVDPAATGESLHRDGDPDYTAVSAWAVTPDFHLIWLECLRFRAEIPDIVPQIQSMYDTYKPNFVAIEAVASNRAVLQLAQRTGMVVRSVSPRGQDKLVRATPAMMMSQSGKIWLPESSYWVDDVVREMLFFTGSNKKGGHDDAIDTLSYACSLIGEYDKEYVYSHPIMLSGRRW